MAKRTFKIYRGDSKEGEYVDYQTEVNDGMVVLDAVHSVQAESANDLGVRWNCKAGKCGSCAAEINGKPKLMCMTRINDLPKGDIKVSPMKTFPIVKDLVCDVSWNYEQNKKLKPFNPGNEKDWKMYQRDVDRVQEFRKCIECFLCQDTCHVIRNHDKKNEFYGPRFFVRAASLDMHPLDTENRTKDLQEKGGLGLCNITRCCTEVCPEDINITDNAIIPMKERVVDEKYDPVRKVWRKIFRVKKV